MAKLTALVFSLLLLAGAFLPGCSKDTLLSIYDSAVSVAGELGVTGSLLLQGHREYGEDHYTGTYTADYDDFTGQECPFGGTMLERRAQEHVEVTCTIERESGSAELTWICGANAAVTLADGEGTFTETAYLTPGSNYFNLALDHFTGSIELEIK